MRDTGKENIREQLLVLAEPQYRAFSAKLLPGTEYILGVRLPVLRKMAQELVKSRKDSQEDLRETENWKMYLEEIGQSYQEKEVLYFEEIMLSGMIIGFLKAMQDQEMLREKDNITKRNEKTRNNKVHLKTDEVLLSEILDWITWFVPMIDNWSVCDSFCAGLKIAKKKKEEMWEFLMPYLHSEREYDLRFVIVMWTHYYIEENYVDRVIYHIDKIHHEGYYVKMAAAWCLSICYVKFPEKTLSYLKGDNYLDDFTYNKTIQKITESLKVSKEEKINLRAMKR